MISLTRFAAGRRIAGEVQKQRALALRHRASAPVRTEVNPHQRRARDGAQDLRTGVWQTLLKLPVATARCQRDAGLRWPGPPHALAVKRRFITANASRMVIAIQPAFSAFDFRSKTPATTPFPRRNQDHGPHELAKHLLFPSSVLIRRRQIGAVANPNQS